jgi:hypothetical protein
MQAGAGGRGTLTRQLLPHRQRHLMHQQQEKHLTAQQQMLKYEQR